MTRCVFHIEANSVPAEFDGNEIHILLYGGKPVHVGTGAIGAQLRDLFLRFGIQPSRRSIDFVSIALAVTAADTFVLREKAANAWARDLHIVLPLREPELWSSARPLLQMILAFLSGDRWTFEFQANGEDPPAMQAIRNHQSYADLTQTDLVSLFSGGLDSTISTILHIEDKVRPLLISHAYQGDARVQQIVKSGLGREVEQISVNAWPTSSLESEISMRTRSFLFIAIATLACDVRSKIRGGQATELLIPENGLIALNAPLTPRRIGALSTRTTHPHYLHTIQQLLDTVRLSAVIVNPYELQTKGEMVESASSLATFNSLASKTLSCGKWKRSGKQCGHCVPCIIRRASLYAGGVDDSTDYAKQDLTDVMSLENDRDDLIAMLSAVRRVDTENLDRWVARSGPLPTDVTRRAALIDVHRRGLLETGEFLHDSGLGL